MRISERVRALLTHMQIPPLFYRIGGSIFARHKAIGNVWKIFGRLEVLVEVKLNV